jgi:hypothetical protein
MVESKVSGGWAIPSVASLRAQMRHVFDYQAAATDLGADGRRWVTSHFSTEHVAARIDNELRRIEKSVQFPLPALHIEDGMGWVSHSEDLELCRVLPLVTEESRGTFPRRQKNTPECLKQMTASGVESPTSLHRSVAQQKPCPRIAIISTFPPTHCGIATFAASLLNGMMENAKGAASFELIPVVDGNASPASTYT